jgi:hypothetical protein
LKYGIIINVSQAYYCTCCHEMEEVGISIKYMCRQVTV